MCKSMFSRGMQVPTMVAHLPEQCRLMQGSHRYCYDMSCGHNPAVCDHHASSSSSIYTQ